MTVDTTKVEPWSADTPDLLTGTLTHTATATLVLADGEQVPLDLEGGTVSFDETRAPRAQATLVCKVPADQAVLDRIDPRTGARLVIDAGYVRPDTLVDVQPLVDLGLRGRSVTRPSDTMTLAAAGDEALVIDNAPSNGGTVTSPSTRGAVNTVIQLVFPAVVPDYLTAATGPAVSQSPMGDKWQLINDLANRIDAQVYDDGLRGWHVVPTPVLSTPALELAVGTGGTIIDSSTDLSREEGFYNRVFATYKWTDTGGTDHTTVSVRSVTTGPYAAATGNIRTLEITHELPATQSEADAATAALVKRTVTRGRSFQLRAISAYWLRPGMTVNVTLPLGDPEEHLVVSVAFDLAAGTMAVTTRLPDGTYTIGA